MILGPRQEKWLKALESKEYKQGVHYLHDSKDQFCCLGVACEILIADGIQIEVRRDDDAVIYGSSDTSIACWQELGLRGNEGKLLIGTYVFGQFCHTLAKMNDQGATFTEIAAFIRSNPENVFCESK